MPVAVLDIGKTNAKLALVEGGAEVALRTTPNTVRQDGPYPHFDVDRLFEFFQDGLAELGPVDAVSITTHGASGALLTADGLALPVLDYEHDGPDALAAEYDAMRPAYDETFSPRMPAGLNLGAQLFWQERVFPRQFARARAFVTYPQYWSWRLTGIARTEPTSLGCHTDLWNPQSRSWSSLARRWSGLMAPVGSAFDITRTPAGLKVASGIHDSNAALLPHLLAREPPFAVVSTGTWIVVAAVGGRLGAGTSAPNVSANVDAFGNPVPSARFMGGRDFERLGSGPEASRHCARETAKCLAAAGAAGPVIVEGPFAANESYRAALAERLGRPVERSTERAGTTLGAALLVLPEGEVARASGRVRGC